MAPLDATQRRTSNLSRLVAASTLTIMSACLSTVAIATVEIVTPTTTAKKARNLPGLHNVVTYADEFLCGGVPEGEQGFATLATLGVKTVISVDGATPDLVHATAHGLRYVHLPISYDTVSSERQLQLAQAIRNVQRPIYVHCHHGKHRSGAALATALVCAGEMSVAEVSERMGVSGTAASYTGLWQAVRAAQPMSPAQLQADPASFPSVTVVTGLVATMAEMDQIIDLVRQSHQARWQAPDDHPDLVAEKETERLASLIASLRDDSESKQYPAGYQQHLQHSIEVSEKLHRAVRDGNAIQAAQMLSTLGQSCKTCHRTYRNK
jgi:protein tyrosine phosphatase (PTP) superfamily phosphohydrolase (DUF442 family)